MILHRIIRFEELGLRCEVCQRATEAIYKLRPSSHTTTGIAGADSNEVRGLLRR
jgi:hypothetical protein